MDCCLCDFRDRFRLAIDTAEKLVGPIFSGSAQRFQRTENHGVPSEHNIDIGVCEQDCIHCRKAALFRYRARRDIGDNRYAWDVC